MIVFLLASLILAGLVFGVLKLLKLSGIKSAIAAFAVFAFCLGFVFHAFSRIDEAPPGAVTVSPEELQKTAESPVLEREND